MKPFTIEQYAGMINKMSEENAMFYVAGAIRESRDIWRIPKNMALLNEDAKIVARHYIKTGGENEKESSQIQGD